MGKLARAKKGKFHSPVRVPIGYDYKDGDLITNEYEKMQVIRLYHDFSAGLPLNRIIRELNENGFTTKYGKWSYSTAHDVLSHKTYTGVIPHKGKFYQGTHEAFITEEMWDNVQTMLYNRAEDMKSRGLRFGKASSCLGGFLFCEKCGKKMSKLTARHKYEYYTCRNGHKAWKMSEMDELVFSEIRKLAWECPVLPQKEEVGQNTECDVIKARIGEIQRKIDRMIDLYSVDDMPLEVLQDKISDLNRQKKALERQLETIPAPEMTESEVISIAESLDDVLSSKDIDQIRAVVASLIEKIEVNGEEITIFWRFS